MGTLAVGGAHTCAVTAAGGVECWGDDADRQVGDPRGGDHLRPFAVPGLTGVRSVAAGQSTSCAVTLDGRVSCWGRLDEGVLGDPLAGAVAAPTALPFAGPVAALDLGFLHGCAALGDGGAACWGFNTTEQVGTGGRWIAAPVAVPGGAVAVGAGGASLAHHSCAVRRDGTVDCWGSDRWGQLGDGKTEQRGVPAPVSGLGGAVAVALGGQHGCALTGDGRVACWGLNGAGQLGDGTTVDHPLPVWVSGLPGKVVGLSAGGETTCGALEGGGIVCWGAHLDGELGGKGAPEHHDAVPTRVPGLEDGVEVAVGAAHACARRRDGAVACWGDNDHGQLGDGTKVARRTPAPVGR